MLLLLVKKKMEILFYSVSFSPPNSSKSITYSLNFDHSWPKKAIRRQLRKHTKSYREQMSPIGLYFQLNSPNNFSANRSVVFKSLYLIVLRLGKAFEDHLFQSNQLGSCVHI